MTLPRILVVGALAVIGLSLPPGPTAVWFLGHDSPIVGVVTIGLWLWKVMLLIHAGLLWIAFSRSAATPRRPATPASDTGERFREDGWLTARRAAIAVASILTIGALLRVVGLGDGLWFDEIKTHVRYMSQPLGTILMTYDDQNQHILYSVLAKLSILGFGDTAAALRLPAVVFGVASLWATYLFGTRVTSRRESLLAVTILAVSYHHIWFSQNARGYTGLLLWTLLSSAFLIDLLRNRERSRWGLSAAYGVTVALALYTHLTAAVLPAAHVLVATWVLWGPAREGETRPALTPLLAGFLLAGTLSLQLYAPVLPQVGNVLLEPSMDGVSIGWKNPLWLITETLAVLGSGVPGGLLAIVPVIGVGAYGFWSYWKRSAGDSLIMVLPVLATVAAIVILGHNLWPRFFFFAAGFIVLIGLRGLFALASLAGARGPTIAMAVSGFAVFGSMSTVPAAWGNKQDYEGAEAFVDGSVASGDAVVTVDMTRLPYDEWRHRDWIPLSNMGELAEVEASHTRTWLIYSFPMSLQALQPEIWERVQSDYREAGRYPGTVGGGDIFVMVRE